MTLLVVLRGVDGLVLAADSRGTFGDPRGVTAQNDSIQKAHVLSGHVAALVAGSGEIGDLVIDEVRRELQQSGIDWATDVMNVLRDRVRENYGSWWPSLPAVPPQQLAATGQVAVRPDLAMLVAGYEQDGTPRMYHLVSGMDFSPMLSNYGWGRSGHRSVRLIPAESAVRARPDSR